MITTKTDVAQKNEFDFFVDELDMLHDLKALLSEYYVATFTSDGSALHIGFNNGQKFRVNVQEVR